MTAESVRPHPNPNDGEKSGWDPNFPEQMITRGYLERGSHITRMDPNEIGDETEVQIMGIGAEGLVALDHEPTEEERAVYAIELRADTYYVPAITPDEIRATLREYIRDYPEQDISLREVRRKLGLWGINASYVRTCLDQIAEEPQEELRPDEAVPETNIKAERPMTKEEYAERRILEFINRRIVGSPRGMTGKSKLLVGISKRFAVDPSRAKEIIESACEAGSLYAGSVAGRMYISDREIPKTLAKRPTQEREQSRDKLDDTVVADAVLRLLGHPIFRPPAQLSARTLQAQLLKFNLIEKPENAPPKDIERMMRGMVSLELLERVEVLKSDRPKVFTTVLASTNLQESLRSATHRQNVITELFADEVAQAE